jgi:hypothetical protein
VLYRAVCVSARTVWRAGVLRRLVQRVALRTVQRVAARRTARSIVDCARTRRLESCSKGDVRARHVLRREPLPVHRKDLKVHCVNSDAVSFVL